MRATYMKLRDGSWGVRIPNQLRKGHMGTFVVHKRDGTTKKEVVKIIWSGNGISLGILAKKALYRTRRRHSRRFTEWDSFEDERRRGLKEKYDIPDWIFDIDEAYGEEEDWANNLDR